MLCGEASKLQGWKLSYFWLTICFALFPLGHTFTVITPSFFSFDVRRGLPYCHTTRTRMYYLCTYCVSVEIRMCSVETV